MKLIQSLNDLVDFGIYPLTMESDALSFRMLCDLSANGRKIVAETFGLAETGFPPNWNSSRGAVASCLLSPDAQLVGILGVIAGVLSSSTVVTTSTSTFILEDKEELIRPVYKDVYDPVDRAWIRNEQVEPHKLRLDSGEIVAWDLDLWGTVVRVFARQTGSQLSAGKDLGRVDGLRNVHQMSGRSK